MLSGEGCGQERGSRRKEGACVSARATCGGCGVVGGAGRPAPAGRLTPPANRNSATTTTKLNAGDQARPRSRCPVPTPELFPRSVCAGGDRSGGKQRARHRRGSAHTPPQAADGDSARSPAGRLGRRRSSRACLKCPDCSEILNPPAKGGQRRAYGNTASCRRPTRRLPRTPRGLILRPDGG